ncbi:hypothetical protein HKK72_20195 [Actinomadura sp. HBU206391]|nr:hypothetical protein [Actinomadura sp. HBU206391]
MLKLDTVREDQAILQVGDRLIGTFAGAHSPEHVKDTVAGVHQRFDGSPIRDFVPVLVERIVRRELQAPPATAGDALEEPDGEKVQSGATQPGQAGAVPVTVAGEEPQSEEIVHLGKAGDVTDRAEKENPESVEIAHPILAGEPSASGEEPPGPPASPTSRWKSRPSNRSLLFALPVVLAVGIAVTAVAIARDPESAPPLATVRGVVGSEKQAFFNDPRVSAALARQGVKIEVDPAGSREIATSVDLGRYDFVFPSSAPAADRIQRPRRINREYAVFSSPMVIATFEPIAELLAKEGIAKRDAVWTFDIARYLRLAAKGTRWDQLKDNKTYPVRKNILITTTDPRSSNSAAMYLSITSYVANGDAVVQGAAAEKKVLPTVSPLFLRQGYTDATTEGPFEDYLSVGMGKTPLVCVYEAQFVGAAVRGQTKPGMVLMYPSPTVLSKHTLVPLNAEGDRVGRLLSTDPELQRLAAVHGFRTADAAQFAKVTGDRKIPVATDLIDVVETPTFDTLENLLGGVSKAYG